MLFFDKKQIWKCFILQPFDYHLNHIKSQGITFSVFHAWRQRKARC